MQNIPWVECFPFNLGLKHPQYVGSVLTIIGCFTLLWTNTVECYLFKIGFCWISFYGFTAFVEHCIKPGKAINFSDSEVGKKSKLK